MGRIEALVSDSSGRGRGKIERLHYKKCMNPVYVWEDNESKATGLTVTRDDEN